MPNTHRRRGDADATKLSSCVASAVWTQFATSSRRLPTDSVAFGNWPNVWLAFHYKILIDQNPRIVTQLWSLFGQFPNCRLNPSAVVWASCELCSHRPPTRRNSTVSSRRRCVLGIIGLWKENQDLDSGGPLDLWLAVSHNNIYITMPRTCLISAA